MRLRPEREPEPDGSTGVEGYEDGGAPVYGPTPHLVRPNPHIGATGCYGGPMGVTGATGPARAYRFDLLLGLAEWLVSMDDPEDVLGREERRSVTLTKIIDRARDALA